MNYIRQYPRTTIFICFQIVDFCTTWIALHFGAHEANIFITYLFATYGVLGLLLLLKTFGVLLGLRLCEQNKSLYRANSIYGLIMLSNCCVLTNYITK